MGSGWELFGGSGGATLGILKGYEGKLLGSGREPFGVPSWPPICGILGRRKDKEMGKINLSVEE